MKLDPLAVLAWLTRNLTWWFCVSFVLFVLFDLAGSR